MNKVRRKQIYKTVIDTLKNAPRLDLPVNIKEIAKSYSGCKCMLVPYSSIVNTRNICYSQMVEYAESTDAFSDYNCNTNQALIYYNDLDESIIKSKRYRWNIAHELGHVALGHHLTYPSSRLFCSSMHDDEYKEAEVEADLFASYILTPYPVLRQLQIQSADELMKICNISKHAAQIRFDQYLKWNSDNDYDRAVLYLFYPILNAKYNHRQSLLQYILAKHSYDRVYCNHIFNDQFKYKSKYKKR